MRYIVTLVAVLLALWGLAGDASAQEFQVIVNASSSVTELTRDQVSRIFRKKSRKLAGADVVPVDLSDDQPVREVFSRTIHGKSTSSMDSYWLRQVFAGKDTPPVKMGSEAELLEFVRSQPGAIGYVRAGRALGAGVRAVPVIG